MIVYYYTPYKAKLSCGIHMGSVVQAEFCKNHEMLLTLFILLNKLIGRTDFYKPSLWSLENIGKEKVSERQDDDCRNAGYELLAACWVNLYNRSFNGLSHSLRVVETLNFCLAVSR
jgi:hypothetical protein